MLEDRKVEFCDRNLSVWTAASSHNTPVDVVIRPEDLRLVYAGDGLLAGRGRVHRIQGCALRDDGAHRALHLYRSFDHGRKPVGKTVGLTVIPFDIHIMHKSAEAQA